jgi:3-phenylpropionate/cinnamic acid dioxygenase small subunit
VATAPASLLQPRLAQLNADYARALDDDRLEDWPGFFGNPCLYVITTADNHRQGHAAGVIYADSPGMLHDRVAALREANVYERHTYRHLVLLLRERRVVCDGNRFDTLLAIPL